MNGMAILNLLALVIVPIISVCIGQILQDRKERRKDKMEIFKILMSSRIYGWTPQRVSALNILDVVYADEPSVRAAWKNLYDKYCVDNPDAAHLEKIKKAEYVLLEEMAKALGYKDKITWETIQNPYKPVGMRDQLTSQMVAQQNYNELLEKSIKAIFDAKNPFERR